MPLTIEDSTIESISSLLENLSREVLSQNNEKEPIQNDLFYVLIIVLMLENRFLPIINGSEVLGNVNSYNVRHFTAGKLQTGLYEAEFVMFGCQDQPLKLVISPLGALMLINLIFKELNGETYSVCLPISRYIVSPRASTVPMIFRDLKHLSLTFKNKVLTAVKSKILSSHGYPSASLVGLPDEIMLFNILLLLPVPDIINVSKTCKRLKTVVDNECLWREMYKRDFTNQTPVETNDWKILYRDKFLKQEEMLRSILTTRSALDHQTDSSSYLVERNRPFYIFQLSDII